VFHQVLSICLGMSSIGWWRRMAPSLPGRSACAIWRLGWPAIRRGFTISAWAKSRSTLGEAKGLTYLIRSTSLRLNGLSGWARFSAEVCGAKVHVIDDPQADHPVYAALSGAKVNDITAAKAMPITPGAAYVFDLGYDDYGWWNELDGAGCRIVTHRPQSTRPIMSKIHAGQPWA
jgi:hypothetical protein